MRITALEEYGLRCMLILAGNDGKRSLTLPEIAEQEGVSISYAGKLLMILRQANMVISERGRNGGYVLARPAEDITIKDIFDALGEPMFSSAHCERYSGTSDSCVHEGDCVVKDIWSTLNSLIGDYLSEISLEKLSKGVLKNSVVEKL